MTENLEINKREYPSTFSKTAIVICLDGSDDMQRRAKAVLISDPGMGIIRHADAGYETAIENARKWNVDIPMLNDE